MSDVLCVYYSRTGKTKQAMEEIAGTLEAELLPLHDAVERGGWKGYLRCGMDAMRQSVQPLSHFETEWPLIAYRLVIVGTPVWAGRCSSPVRAFLQQCGKDMRNVAFLATRAGDSQNQEVFRQMDLYLPEGHHIDVSLRADSVGYAFWQEEFLRQVQEFLNSKK